MTTFEADQLVGKTAVDPDGDKIGRIGQVYLDDDSGQPTWITVSTGLFGTRDSFAPLYGAGLDDEDVILAVSKDQVKDAPNVEDDEHVDDAEQQELDDYYAGLLGTRSGWQDWQRGEHRTRTGQAGDQGQTGPAAERNREVRERGTDEAMTRSEEQLRVGTENIEIGRARLRKYVVTEHVTQTVPVSHEEVRIEREPITEANLDDATSGPEISESEHEVTLRAEQPVGGKQTVPVERVRMNTETVSDQAHVQDTVRKEQIEVEGDEATGRRDR
jgi:uncharacterized protein (TIGR02271 family)